MLDDKAFDALGKLEEWGWQKPDAIPAAEFEQILENCRSFLGDGSSERSAQTCSVLERLAEQSNQRLFRFLPEFRRRFESADAALQHDIFQKALDWSSNRFERMILQNTIHGWKLLREAGLVDEALGIDGLIMRAAHVRWQKVATIVGTVIMARRGLVDTAVADHVKALVQRGILEAQGDLSDMRNSEVRLSTGETYEFEGA